MHQNQYILLASEKIFSVKCDLFSKKSSIYLNLSSFCAKIFAARYMIWYFSYKQFSIFKNLIWYFTEKELFADDKISFP